MPKIFNRAVQLGGESLKVGTPIVTVLEYDADSNVLKASGATVPTDGDAGYAKGCQFIQTDGSNGTVLYVNEGSATSADFNVVKTNGTADEVETVAATNVITAAESGKTFFLNHATEFASTLPAPAAGLRYRFVVANAPETASYTIGTNGGDNIIIGGVNELEVDTGDDGPYSSAADTITFVDSVAVVGDWVEVISDGTSWFLTGQTNADGGVTLTAT